MITTSGARLVAAAAILLIPPPIAGAQGERRSCLDEGCTRVALFHTAETPSGSGETTLVAPRYGAWGIDLAGMDRTTRPGDDFFRFANGKWASKTTIPPDRANYGAFAMLRDVSEAQVRAILDEWARRRTCRPAATRQRSPSLYRSFLDEAAVERLDAAPLTPKLKAIRARTTREALAR
jgi:putative endopeptidase